MSTKFCNTHIPDMGKVASLVYKSGEAGRLSNFGPALLRLREELHGFLSLLDHKDIVPVSSGHVAIMAALAALGSRKVVVPAYTFSSTLQAAKLQGIETHVLDVGGFPYLTVRELEDAQTAGVDFDTVLFVAPVSIVPKEIFEIERWCRLRGIKLIIDGAATFGTPGVYNVGDAYCLSFHATKSLPMGEGGAVIINKDLFPRVKSFVCFGMDSNRKIVNPGINGKMSDYTAAVGVVLLEEISERLELRRENAKLYSASLKDYVFESVPNTVYQSFPVFVGKHASKCIQKLKSQDFEVNSYYVPLADKKNAMGFYKENICLPCHPDVSSKEMDGMISIILENT